jgi:hypothetical protein
MSSATYEVNGVADFSFGGTSDIAVYIAGSYAIEAYKVSSSAAGMFTDTTNTVYLADGTYAINATGDVRIDGNIYDSSPTIRISPYNSYLYDSYGLLVYVSPEFKALCVSTCSDEFRVPFDSTTDIFNVLGTDTNFYYSYYLTDNNTYFNLPYQSLDSSGYNLNFRLYGNSLLNNSILICTRDIINTNLGIFNCNLTGLSYESYSFKLYLDDALKIQDTFNIPTSAKFGFLGLVIAFFMVLIFILLFIEYEKLMLIGAVVGIAVSLYFKFIMGGVVSIVFLIMGIGAVLLMDRR